MYGSYAMFTRTRFSSSTFDRNNKNFSHALKFDLELIFSTLNKSCQATFSSKIIKALKLDPIFIRFNFQHVEVIGNLKNLKSG